MGKDPPGWYYVGNGQLRYKFGDFWTDQYKTIGHSERSVSTESLEPSNSVPADTSPSDRWRLLTTPRLTTAVCVCLLGLGVGGGLLKPEIRHELVSWAAAQASNLSALISRPAPPLPTTTPGAKAKADAKARADAKAKTDARANANAKARADAKVRADAKAKADAKVRADARARADAAAATKAKSTPPHLLTPQAPPAKPRTTGVELPAAPANATTKRPVTTPSSPPNPRSRSVTNPR